MGSDKVLAESPWSYVLFQRGDRILLTFVVGGVAEVDVTVAVPNEEAVALSGNPSQLKVYIDALKANMDELFRVRLPAPVWPDVKGDA